MEFKSKDCSCLTVMVPNFGRYNEKNAKIEALKPSKTGD